MKFDRCARPPLVTLACVGGDADLDFVDSNDPFAEGILFRVRPPKKNWKAMSMLSGGEKTLSSLVLPLLRLLLPPPHQHRHLTSSPPHLYTPTRKNSPH